MYFAENCLFERYGVISILLARMIGDSALSNTPIVLDTTANDIVCEPLARTDSYTYNRTLIAFF